MSIYLKVGVMEGAHLYNVYEAIMRLHHATLPGLVRAYEFSWSPPGSAIYPIKIRMGSGATFKALRSAVEQAIRDRVGYVEVKVVKPGPLRFDKRAVAYERELTEPLRTTFFAVHDIADGKIGLAQGTPVEATVTEIAAAVKLSRRTVSRHLNQLVPEVVREVGPGGSRVGYVVTDFGRKVVAYCKRKDPEVRE